MRFEKINSQKIKCILTCEDLASRHIVLSDLAYGNEKTKRLFDEMMKRAKEELGFEPGTFPLAIEAIPMKDNDIMLIISKIEFPEELDTNFSRFTEYMEESDEEGYSNSSSSSEGPAKDFFDFLKDVKNRINQSANQIEKEGTITIDGKEIPVNITKMYGFQSMDDAIRLSKVLNSFYGEENSLYKTKSGSLMLIVQKGNSSPEDFNKVCNILSEYSNQLPYYVGQEAHFKEQYKTLISRNAIETLSQM